MSRNAWQHAGPASAMATPQRPLRSPPPVPAATTPAVLAQLMWNAAPQLLAVLDTDSRIAASNPAWQRLLGWDAASLRGRALLSLALGEDQAAARQWLQQVVGGGGPAGFTGRWRCADQRPLRLHWGLVLRDGLLCAIGQPVGDAGPSTDRSAEPLAEPLADAASVQLAGQHTLRGLAQLTGGLSHELNNLLQTLRNTLELIQHRPGEPRQVAGWAASALGIVEHGADLTAQLRAFAGRQQPVLQTLQVAALLQGLRERLQGLLGAHTTLQLDLPAPGALATGDATQLAQAVLGLARNAADAMPHGGRLQIRLGRAHVEEDSELATGDYVTIDVTDSGAGMSEAVRARAFEPFFTTRAPGRGCGLGLSAMHGNLQQIGGAVRLPQAAPGMGQTVRLLLPAAAP